MKKAFGIILILGLLIVICLPRPLFIPNWQKSLDQAVAMDDCAFVEKIIYVARLFEMRGIYSRIHQLGESRICGFEPVQYYNELGGLDESEPGFSFEKPYSLYDKMRLTSYLIELNHLLNNWKSVLKRPSQHFQFIKVYRQCRDVPSYRIRVLRGNKYVRLVLNDKNLTIEDIEKLYSDDLNVCSEKFLQGFKKFPEKRKTFNEQYLYIRVLNLFFAYEYLPTDHDTQLFILSAIKDAGDDLDRSCNLPFEICLAELSGGKRWETQLSHVLTVDLKYLCSPSRDKTSEHFRLCYEILHKRLGLDSASAKSTRNNMDDILYAAYYQVWMTIDQRGSEADTVITVPGVSDACKDEIYKKALQDYQEVLLKPAYQRSFTYLRGVIGPACDQLISSRQ